jgi:hypothetical protein
MPYRLTPEIENQLIQYIRAGGFAWAAAEAAGVPRAVFRRWLARGKRHRRQPYRRFYENVLQARAQARLAAEIKVREQDPRFWLRHGPGRERPGQPGWTNPVRPAPPRAGGTKLGLDAPQLQQFLADVAAIRDPFPSAADMMVAAADKWRGKNRR